MTPEDLDLISFVRDGALHLMVAAGGDEGWYSNAVPNVGAIGPLAAQVAQQFPDMFATVKDCEMWLTLVHAKNMHRRQNSAGQAYPAHLPPRWTPCSLIFKSPQCGYTGEVDACDRSPDTCRALGNFKHFGGQAGQM